MRRFAAASLALHVITGTAIAADPVGWRRDGTPVAVAPASQSAPQVIVDGAGGAYIAWHDLRSGYDHVFVQRLASDGTVSPGWPVHGRFAIDGSDPTIARDPRGGLLVGVTTYYGPTLVRVRADGVVLTSEPVPGADAGAMGPSRRLRPAAALKQPEYVTPILAPTPDGGMLLAWSKFFLTGDNAFVLRYGANMQLAPGWPGAVAVAPPYNQAYGPVVCSGDSGDVYVAWVGWNRVSASRLTRTGQIAPGWPRVLEEFSEPGDQVGAGIVPDGAGGAVVIWQRPEAGVRAQRLSPSGESDPSWPQPWRALSRFPGEPAIVRHPGSRWANLVHQCAVVADGAGGAFVAWSDRRADDGDVYLQWVLASGDIAPGWPEDGLAVCSSPDRQASPSLAADGAGGVLLAWQDTRGGIEADVYAARIQADGRPAAGWPAAGLQLCGQGGPQQTPRLAANASGGAIVAWQDGRCGDPNLFATRVAGDGAAPDADPFPTVSAGFESAEIGAQAARLTWQVSGTTDMVELERQGPDSDAWTVLGRAAPDAAGRVSFTDSGLYGGCAYRYGVRLAGCGRFGETPVTIPDADGFLRATATPLAATLEGCTPSLAWVISPGPFEQVRVYRRNETTGWVPIGESQPDETRTARYRDAEASGGIRHGYRLGLISCGIERAAGETWVEASPQGATPAAVAFDAGAVAVTWFVNSVSDSADIQRSGPGEPWSTIARAEVGTVRSLRFADPDVFAGCEYRYRIGLRDCRIAGWFAETLVTVPADGGFRSVTAAVASATIAAGVPVVRWQISGPAERVRVARRTSAGDWATVAELTVGPPYLVTYEDRNAEPGVRYGYRLELTTCGRALTSEDAWLELADRRWTLALEPPRPNPARNSVTISFALPDASPAWIEMHDALGRLIERREVGSLGPGRHAMSFARRPGVPAGLYWVRLRHGGQVQRASVSLLD